MLKKTSKIIFIIFTLAFVLRVLGVWEGFPFIFHPDEPTIIRSALGVRFHINPGHFDWPHLYIYFNYFVYMGFAAIRNFLSSQNLLQAVRSTAPIIWDDNLIFYLITRILTAGIGALTVVPIYLAARRLFNEKVGILSALAFAVLPFHVRHSHYALPDIPMVFMLSWALYFASSILDDPKPSNYAKSGMFVGFSASAKYNGGLSAIIIPLAHFLRIIKNKILTNGTNESLLSFKGLGSLILSAISAFIGFVICTPFAVLDYETFSRTDGPAGAFWQFTNVGSVTFQLHLAKFFNDFSHKLFTDYGYLPIIVYISGLTVLFVRIIKKRITKHEFSLLFLYIPSLFYIYYVSGFEKSRSHYYLVSYPFVAIIFGYFVYWIYSLLKRKSSALSFVVLFLLFALPLYRSTLESITFINGDTRNILYSWLPGNIQRNQAVIINGSDIAAVLTKNNNLFYMDNFNDWPVDLVKTYYITSDNSKPKKPYRLFYRIDNTLRLGPVISVYRYGK